MAAKKYVALKAFGGFQEGDGVSVADAGDDADMLIASGMIKLTDEPVAPDPSIAGVDSPTFDATKSSEPSAPEAKTVTGKNGTITATFG